MALADVALSGVADRRSDRHRGPGRQLPGGPRRRLLRGRVPARRCRRSVDPGHHRPAHRLVGDETADPVPAVRREGPQGRPGLPDVRLLSGPGAGRSDGPVPALRPARRIERAILPPLRLRARTADHASATGGSAFRTPGSAERLTSRRTAPRGRRCTAPSRAPEFPISHYDDIRQGRRPRKPPARPPGTAATLRPPRASSRFRARGLFGRPILCPMSF